LNKWGATCWKTGSISVFALASIASRDVLDLEKQQKKKINVSYRGIFFYIHIMTDKFKFNKKEL